RTTSIGATAGSKSSAATSRPRRRTWRSSLPLRSLKASPTSVTSVAFGSATSPRPFPLATALRQQLDAIRQARVVDANRSQVLDDVYEYVCGQEFQHYVTNTVVAALTMKSELDAERTASERLFKK